MEYDLDVCETVDEMSLVHDSDDSEEGSDSGQSDLSMYDSQSFQSDIVTVDDGDEQEEWNEPFFTAASTGTVQALQYSR
ncbi:hypothetical protein Unana1_00105 [Umbelopsis nana]